MWPAVDEAPMEMEAPVQIAVLEITDAEGSGLTVIVTDLEFTQPREFVSVTV